MTLISEIFTSQLKKAGVDINNADIKTFLEHPELAKIEAPEAVKTAFDGLITVEDAKSNESVYGHIKKQNLDGIDAVLNEYLKTLPEAKQNELKSLDTFKRTKALIESIREAEKAAYTDKIKGKDQLAELLQAKEGELATKLQEWQEEKSRMQKEAESKTMDLVLDRYLSFEYGLPVSHDIAKKTGRNVLEDELAKRRAKMKLNGLDIELYSADSENNLPYQEGNQKMTFKQFFERTMAENKLPKVSEGNDKQQQNNYQHQYQNNSNNNSNKPRLDSSQEDAAIRDLQQAGAYN